MEGSRHNTVETRILTTSRKQPPLFTDQFSKILKVFQLKSIHFTCIRNLSVSALHSTFPKWPQPLLELKVWNILSFITSWKKPLNGAKIGEQGVVHNIIAFLGSTRGRNFLMGSTGFFLKIPWLFAWIKQLENNRKSKMHSVGLNISKLPCANEVKLWPLWSKLL